jgi:Flp pilus assembly pilin Flp
MSALLRKGLGDKGATVIEYAMVAFFISIAAFSVLVSVGGSVSSIFQTVGSSM